MLPRKYDLFVIAVLVNIEMRWDILLYLNHISYVLTIDLIYQSGPLCGVKWAGLIILSVCAGLTFDLYGSVNLRCANINGPRNY